MSASTRMSLLCFIVPAGVVWVQQVTPFAAWQCNRRVLFLPNIMESTDPVIITAALTIAIGILALLLTFRLGFGSYTLSKPSEPSWQQALARAAR